VYPTQSLLRNKGRALVSFIALTSALAGSHAVAQDFFRELGTSRSSGGIGPVVPSEYNLQDGTPSGLRRLTPVDDSEEDSNFNIALGPVRMKFAVGLGVEWNDNITLSQDNRESDFIFRPIVNMEVLWPLGALNTLRFNVSASWAKYLEHSELDSGGLIISPNSTLALTFEVGNVQITVRDRFSYQEEPYEIAPLSNIARYQRYENQAGIDVEWPINEKTTLTVGYDHYNLWSKNETFRSEDRSIDTLFIRPSYQLTPGVKVGIFGSYSMIDFDSDNRSDSDAVLLGPFIDWQITDYVTMYLEAGYQGIHHDGESSFDQDFFAEINEDFFAGLPDDERDLFRDSDDASSYYVKFQLNHTPSDVFEHGVSFTKTAEIGFGTNFYDLYHAEYGATYKGIRATEISPVVFYEYYETSGEFSENASRIGVALGIRHHLSNSITLGLDYRFLFKDSNFEGADYYQNLVFLSLFYRF
jgi:hypothetical protein